MNLQKKNVFLPEVIIIQIGTIREYIKPDDHLICDISSLDLWLNVEMQSEEVSLVIFIEVKSYKSRKISDLKKILLEIADQILQANSMNIVLDVGESQIKKLDIPNQELKLSTQSKSILKQNEDLDKTISIDEDFGIGDEFDYIDNHVFLDLRVNEKKTIESRLYCNSSISESINNISCPMPVRNLRIEPLAKKYTQTHKKHQIINDFRGGCCSCILF